MRKKGLLKSVVAASAVVMIGGVIGGNIIIPTEVEAANYSSNKGNVTIASDGTVTVDFTLSEVDQTQVLYGFGICLFEEKPELLSNDKLVNSGNIFYDSDECKHAYHKELETPVSEGTYDNTYTITYSPDTDDINGFDANANPTVRSGGISLAEALQTGKDWYIVVGVHTTFGGVWHTNCDLYLGQVSEVTGGEYFVPHEHNWNYDVEDNKIYAWCDEQKLECGNYGTGKEDAKLIDVLTADDMIYSGEPYAGADVTKSIAEVTGATETGIVYYKSDESGKTTDGELLNNPPTDAGSYYVTYSITDNGNEYKAVKSFDILPYDISTGSTETDLGDPESIPGTIVITIDGSDRTLTVGTDCDLVYDESGVTIIGKGNYTGTVIVEKTDNVDDSTENDDTTGSDDTDLDDDDDEDGIDVTGSGDDEELNDDDYDLTIEDKKGGSGDDEKGEFTVDISDDDTNATVTTGTATVTSQSPSTGYDPLVGALAGFMMMGMAGMVLSARRIKKSE